MEHKNIFLLIIGVTIVVLLSIYLQTVRSYPINVLKTNLEYLTDGSISKLELDEEITYTVSVEATKLLQKLIQNDSAAEFPKSRISRIISDGVELSLSPTLENEEALTLPNLLDFEKLIELVSSADINVRSRSDYWEFSIVSNSLSEDVAKYLDTQLVGEDEINISKDISLKNIENNLNGDIEYSFLVNRSNNEISAVIVRLLGSLEVLYELNLTAKLENQLNSFEDGTQPKSNVLVNYSGIEISFQLNNLTFTKDISVSQNRLKLYIDTAL